MTTPTGFTQQADGRVLITKDPDASLRYGIDVAGLLASGDTIASVSIPASAGITAASASFSGTVVSARISGGSVGQTGSATLRWVTTGGDTDERTLHFQVEQR